MANPNIVNVTSILGESVGSLLTTTLTTILASLGAGVGQVLKINSIILSNASASAINCTISHDIGGTVYPLAAAVPIPGNSGPVQLLDKPIYLNEGDEIRGGAVTGAQVTCHISFERIS